MKDVVDAHIHLSHHYSGGLTNTWHPHEAGGFQRDWTEADYRASVAKGAFEVKAAVYVQCSNSPPLEEAKWVLSMVDDPSSIVVGIIAEINAQGGASSVNSFLDQLRESNGSLPHGLKGGRVPFLGEVVAPDACLDAQFLEGLQALQEAKLIWEFACKPSMAPYLAECCGKFPEMTFVIDHLAHNTSEEGGDIETWGPAIDKLGLLRNVYAKMGAVEEWNVSKPSDYMDRAIAVFGFDRILYESNWFVSEALGDSYDKTASLLLAACHRAGATTEDLRKVFKGNACKVYSLDL